MGARHSHTLHVHGHTRVHHLAAHVKVVATVAFVFAVALTPRATHWPYLLHAAVLVGVVATARLPVGFVASRAAVVLPFVGAALLIPFVATGERIDVVGVGVSAEGLRAAGHVLARSVLGVAASVVLAATTELPRILAGLDRLRVPSVLTQIAGFMLRYLEVVAGELSRMRTSMAARGYEPRGLHQVRPIAAASGALFVRSHERGERVHRAMLARGYTGTMPDLHDDTTTLGDWVVGLAPAALAVTTTLAARLL